MIQTVFEWRGDRNTGEYGWIQKGFPNFNASDGRMVAHDTLEHFAGGDGSLTDEMLAFGAIMFVRGESGWFYQEGGIYDPAQSCALDISEFLHDVAWGNSHLKTAPRTCRLDDNTIENYIQDAVHGGLRIALNEYPEKCGQMRQSDALIKSMIGWMRIGYRKAVKRFYDNPAYQVADCFNEIRKKVDKHFSHGEFGEELIVKVNPRTLKVNVDSKYAFEDADYYNY